MSGTTILGSGDIHLEQAVLAHTLLIAAMPQPLGVFLSLSTTQPSNTVRGTEVSGNGYMRQGAGFAYVGTLPTNIVANAATIEFPAALASWGTIGWWELWDTPSLGNRLYWGTIVDPADGITPITRTVLGGDIVRFQAGVIRVTAL